MFFIKQNAWLFVDMEFLFSCSTWYTYIHKLYLSSDFSVAYIASISDPNLLI